MMMALAEIVYAHGTKFKDDPLCKQDGPHGERGKYQYAWGHHLRTMNGYEGGALTRRADFTVQKKIRDRSALG